MLLVRRFRATGAQAIANAFQQAEKALARPVVFR
jgi:hypothetical protein